MTAPGGERVLDAMAEVMERQARVARAESALVAARRRLGESLDRLSSIATEEGAELPPFAVAALEGRPPRLPPAGSGEEERLGTLRARIVGALEAHPGEVFTAARLAPMVGSPNRDSIRNTLLTLAARGRIAKLGEGQYQARTREASP